MPYFLANFSMLRFAFWTSPFDIIAFSISVSYSATLDCPPIAAFLTLSKLKYAWFVILKIVSLSDNPSYVSFNSFSESSYIAVTFRFPGNPDSMWGLLYENVTLVILLFSIIHSLSPNLTSPPWSVFGPLLARSLYSTPFKENFAFLIRLAHLPTDFPIDALPLWRYFSYSSKPSTISVSICFT